MNRSLRCAKSAGRSGTRAKAFLNEHQDENGMLSPEDAAQYERMEQEVVDIGHAIEREERAAQMERELNAPTMAPLPPGRRPAPTPAPAAARNEYKAAFWTAMRNRGGHLSVQNALQIGTDSEGGYLVPDEYERTLVDALREENRLRGLCKIIRTSSGEPQDPAGSFPRHGELGRGGRHDPRIRRRLWADHHRRAQDRVHDQGFG